MTEVRGEATVPIDGHQFWVSDLNPAPGPFDPILNNMIAPREGAVSIFTGVSGGEVSVLYLAQLEAPQSLEFEGWEEIVETNLEVRFGRIIVSSVATMQAYSPNLAVAGNGNYRIRVHARGRGVAWDLVPDGIVEYYKIVIWPQPPSADQLLRSAERDRRSSK